MTAPIRQQQHSPRRRLVQAAALLQMQAQTRSLSPQAPKTTVLRETTSRGLCRLFCPSLMMMMPFICSSSERRAEGDCEKEGEEKGSARGSLHWCWGVREGACTGAATMPKPSTLRAERTCFGCRESDFALQRLVECRALETE